MSSSLQVRLLTVLGLITSAGCDAASGGEGGASGPLTRCDLGIVEENPGTGDFGAACASDVDCDYGVCLQPGAAGNLTNTQFGFCTRGCDCNDDPASQLSDAEDATYVCLYPPTPDQHKRHVVPLCASVADCQALDSRWTACRAPSAGGVKKVCHAE